MNLDDPLKLWIAIMVAIFLLAWAVVEIVAWIERHPKRTLPRPRPDDRDTLADFMRRNRP